MTGVVVTAAACALVLVGSTSITDGAPAPTCAGSTATIVSRAGNEVTRGTRGADVIVGTRSGDDIRGGGGDDTICARGGNDRVSGGGGADRIWTGNGHDSVAGGPGADVVGGGAGADTIEGGRGSDVLRGGRGPDRCLGGPGRDRFSGCNDTRCERHVAPNGRDNASGRAGDPWATISHAAEAVPDRHCTVVVASGVHRGTVDIDRRFATSFRVVAAELHGAVLESSTAAIDIDGARNVVLDGFVIRHVRGGEDMVVSISGSGRTFAENITLRNSIVHDSYDNDLVKVNHAVRDVLIENTISYNPGPGEHHYDLNGVEDVVLRNNIMFNDYEGSGRAQPEGKMFVIIKDSNSTGLDLGGSKRITLDGNVFIGWAVGGAEEAMVKAGNDGKAHREAIDIVFENNLFVSNGPDDAWAVFGAAGVRNLTIRNNTVNHVPGEYVGYRLEVKGDNQPNESVTICNNVWAAEGMEDFAKVTGPISGLREHHNLYWNGGDRVPDFQTSDGSVRNPGLRSAPVTTPRSGDARVWLRRLVEDHGIPNQRVVGVADPGCASSRDILGNRRGSSPDVGAVELSAR